MEVILESPDNSTKSTVKYYRYQPADADRIGTLSIDKIWVSNPLSFNDPVDTVKPIENGIRRSPFDLETLKQAVKILFSGKRKNYFDTYFNDRCLDLIEYWSNSDGDDLAIYEVISAIEDHYKTLGIICLAPKFDSQIMWSHYASQHQGFAIEYSYDFLSFDPEKNFTREDVSYTNAEPYMCISEFLLTPHLAYKRLLATKHTEWSYEKEVRLVHKSKSNQFVELPQGLKLSALIAGPKMSLDHKKLLYQKAMNLNIDIKFVQNNGYTIFANRLEIF